MNKNDLVQKLAERTGLSKMDAQKAVDGVFELITDSLKSGDEVRVTGFGVFAVSSRAGGKGRNPQTGEEIVIKASKAARFRAYDKMSGREVGAVFMEQGQTGSPMTYMLNGRQYVAIASGSNILTFALK